MKNSKLFELLNIKKIPYAIIEGEYDFESYSYESDLFKSDLDVVLKHNSFKLIYFLMDRREFEYLGNHSFRENATNTIIDLYFNYLNVGYYHFLKVAEDSFIKQKVSRNEYITYQILDPLLKFSKYHSRHKFRLEKYFSNGISTEVKFNLEFAIGKLLSYYLLSKLKKRDYIIPKIFIKTCKFRLLFINGNFVKMLKSRFFHNV